MGVVPAQLVLVGQGSQPGFPRQVPGGLARLTKPANSNLPGRTLPLANPTAWGALIRALYQKEWIVFAKEPFGGPEQVLKYLTGYTHRVALSNRRLVKLQDDRVTFTWKDYADGCRRKEMTLDAVEFVRRFAMHIIPKGLVRIRQYGLLAHRDRGERLALCRSLLTTQARSTIDQETDSPRPSPGDGSTASDQTANGVEPQAPLVDPKTTLQSPMTGFIVLLLVLLIATGDISSLISSPTEPPLVVIAQDHCPSCGVGRLQTIWRAARPGHEERQQHSHPGQLMTRLHPNDVLEFHDNPLRLGPLRHIRSWECPVSAPPRKIVMIRSIGTILILSRDTLTKSLVVAPGRLGPGSLQAGTNA